MPVYEVTDRDGNVITRGGVVTDFRREAWVFDHVSRGTEYNGTALVIVHDSPDPGASEREFYDRVFDLTVVTVTP